MTDQPDSSEDGEAPTGSEVAVPVAHPPEADATEIHRTKQRRLLFGIEVTLFGLVLIVGGGGQAGFFVGIFGLLIALSGL